MTTMTLQSRARPMILLDSDHLPSSSRLRVGRIDKNTTGPERRPCMVTRLIKQNGELHLVLDRELLESLHFDETTALELSLQGDALLVRSTTTDERGELFNAALAESHQNYSKTFQRLAE